MINKLLVIPDVQAKPGHDFTYLNNIGKYIVAKKPEVIVQIGDFADMPSLSSYDVGKKSFEGRRYKKDVEATWNAMAALLSPLLEYNAQQKRNGKKQYHPRKVLTLGNHENRIDRAINDDAKLEGMLSINDLKYANFGWEVHPFLEVVTIEGIAFSHYFVTGTAGRPSSTAAAQLNKQHMSCISGHQQGRQMAQAQRADGSRVTSIIAGSCYEHNEDYLGAQGNNHWRGVIMLHNVNNGSFDECFVPLDYIKAKYGNS